MKRLLHIAMSAVVATLMGSCETEYLNVNPGDIISPGGFYNTITTTSEVLEYEYAHKGTIIPTFYKQSNSLSLEFKDVAFAPEMTPITFTIEELNESPSRENYYTASNVKPVMNGVAMTEYNITSIAVLYDDIKPDLKVQFYCIADVPIYGIARYEVYFSYQDEE